MAISREKFYRTKTHEDYQGGSKKARKNIKAGILDKYITDDAIHVQSKEVFEDGYFNDLDHNFGVRPIRTNQDPIVHGAIGLLCLAVIAIPTLLDAIETDTYNNFGIGFSSLMILVISFCGIYYYKMPSKELIWNRRDGLLTFPGALWSPNITMHIENVAFAFSGPSSHGTGAYQLMIVRPGKPTTYYQCTTGHTAYEDLSFLLWYMDRHRPLPPGTAFDPYRQQDYERRRAAGFPQPLFPARFDTPEATPQQQAERQRIGGW